MDPRLDALIKKAHIEGTLSVKLNDSAFSLNFSGNAIAVRIPDKPTFMQLYAELTPLMQRSSKETQSCLNRGKGKQISLYIGRYKMGESGQSSRLSRWLGLGNISVTWRGLWLFLCSRKLLKKGCKSGH